MSNIVVGIDAGGSKTRVLVSTLSGKILSDVTGPGTVMAPGDADHCASIIAPLIETALAEMKLPAAPKKTGKRAKAASADSAEAAPFAEDDSPEEASPYADEAEESVSGSDERADERADEPLGEAGETAIEDDSADDVIDPHGRPLVLFAGVAGTGREEEQVALQSALTRLELADEVVVDTDASIALADAFGEGAGIVLVAGTGSIAFGRSPAGVHARCGGWGLAIGDEGSGAWIGKKALSVIAAAHDGREPETALLGAVLTAAQVNEPEELIPWAIAANKETLAALAPTVMAIAMQDDLRANAIVDMAVEELMLHVRALGKRLFVDERAAFEVALAGGLLTKGSVIRKRLEKRLKNAVPGATVKPGAVDGARGAVWLARWMVQKIAV